MSIITCSWTLGAGTSRLARRLTTRLRRVAGLTRGRTAFVTTRPFWAPHHTISDLGVIGGGQWPLPGEVSRAHHGSLYLDERPAWTRHGLEVLRQPLEEGVLYIQSPARHRPHRTRRPGRASGTCADRHGLIGTLLRRLVIFA